MGFEIGHWSFGLPRLRPIMHLASPYISRHRNVLVGRLRFVRLVMRTRLICIIYREGNQAISADICRLQLQQRRIVVIIQREDSFLGEDNIFLCVLELVLVVLDRLHYQIIQKSVLLNVVRQLRSLGQSQRKLSRKQQLSLRRLGDFFRYIFGEGSFVKFLFDALSLKDIDAFQLLEFRIELFVAHQKPLWKLSQPLKTISEVIDCIQYFLVRSDLCLPLDDFLIDLADDSRVDAFELQTDIFFDNLLVSPVLLLLLLQLQDLQRYSFP